MDLGSYVVDKVIMSLSMFNGKTEREREKEKTNPKEKEKFIMEYYTHIYTYTLYIHGEWILYIYGFGSIGFKLLQNVDIYYYYI